VKLKTVVLVGCGKQKLARAAQAKDLYTGQLFRLARAYAERVGDEWAILSAKHFLVMPDDVIEPYDLCLGDLDRDHLRQWIGNTNWFIRSRWKTWENPVRFVCLAGKEYARALGSRSDGGSVVPVSALYPLEGMGLGKRIQFLKGATK
jgi:hypothetical protein